MALDWSTPSIRHAIEGVIATTDANAASKAQYRRKVKAMFVAMPELADKSIAAVEREDIAALWEAMRDYPTQRRDAVRLLARAIDVAIGDGQRSGNPARGWAGGKTRHRSRRPPKGLGKAILRTTHALERSGVIDRDFGDFCKAALWTGLRHEELLRLRWRDVEVDEDDDPPTITVWLKIGKDETIPIGPHAAAMLRSRRPHNATGWVWPATRGKNHRGQSWIASNWERVLEQLRQDGVDVLDRSTGETITPCVTRTINLVAKTREGARAGVSLMATMRSVRHERMDTTEIYCPAVSMEVQEANKIVEQVITPEDTMPEARTDVRAESIGARIQAAREAQRMTRSDAAKRASSVIAELVGQGRDVPAPLRKGMTATQWAGWEQRCSATEKIEIAALALGTSFAALAEGRR